MLNEWQKTMLDLPAGLRQAYEMVSYHLKAFRFMVLVGGGMLTSLWELCVPGFGELSTNG